MSGYAEGGRIVPRRQVEGEVAIRLSEPESVFPDAIVAKYGREHLIKLQGGGQVHTASEMLAAYDEESDDD